MSVDVSCLVENNSSLETTKQEKPSTDEETGERPSTFPFLSFVDGRYSPVSSSFLPTFPREKCWLALKARRKEYVPGTPSVAIGDPATIVHFVHYPIVADGVPVT